MALTVRDLAEVDSLGLVVVAGAQGADREISWAHAIELTDPTPYLAGGELVMTTGINIGADAAAQHAYVARLAAAGTVALAVDTGTTIADVPPAVRAAGDEFGLPVFEVPESTPFIAIARVVIDALKAEELRSVQRVVDAQEVLARATLRGGIPGVVGALAERLSATVVVVDPDGTVLAAAGSAQERLIAVLGEQAASTRRHGAYVTADGDAYVTIQNLRAAQPVRGRLAVRTSGPMSNADRLLIAHAVSLISIAIEKPARVVDAEQLLRIAVTREMLTGAGSVDSAVLRYFGFEPDGDVVVASFTGAGPLLAAEHVLGRVLTSFLMAPTGDEIVLVVPAGGSRRRIRTVVQELEQQTGVPVRGGMSRPVRLADLHTALEQARIAAHAGAGRFSDFGELGPMGVLLDGRSVAELRVLAAPLDSLAGGDELIPTLAAFLGRNGQMEAAAAELTVHRHTMRNRMRRICQLLGDDLESADTRAQLWLALKAWQLLESRRPG
ncbi:PucR family transcriptional regulator [Mycolicibacterium neworleansense]|uniref:Purine catabolism PurC domain-containing protein n=1 Tax=Mycolicibacterium neworleansense TaxID=146018 RepID=A0A0H5S373_9MYCO|nr:PucR family transcriptional regulator [Mycolicibacterium neworleansense]MCV7364731.1 PucR family transcriptional regulator ligand-binding domain-containing protein [Mycolicibacterium neworleansense]CRZ15524.1 purine catabolism PurC domain-containing protein [Mycolicibacterium neworleansense]